MVAAVLQQRVHRHDEETGKPADQDHQRHRDPDFGDEIHRDDDETHGDAERDDANRLVERDAQRRGDRAEDSERDPADQHLLQLLRGPPGGAGKIAEKPYMDRRRQ